MQKITIDEIAEKILTGISIGVILTVVPNAIFGEIAKSLHSEMKIFTYIGYICKTAELYLPAIIALSISLQFNMTKIQTGAIIIAAAIAANVSPTAPKNLILLTNSGGNILNTALIVTIAIIIISVLDKKLKSYSNTLLPLFVIIGIGGLGIITLNPINNITLALVDLIKKLISFNTPFINGSIIAMIFALIAISPFSTIGFASLILLNPNLAVAASLGIIATSFALTVCSYRYNNWLILAIQIFGTPKIQIANVIKKPLIILPIILNAAIVGAISIIIDFKGSITTAGLGLSGLMSPIYTLNKITGGLKILNILITFSVFIIIPLILALFFNYIFTKLVPIIKAENYTINYKD